MNINLSDQSPWEELPHKFKVVCKLSRVVSERTRLRKLRFHHLFLALVLNGKAISAFDSTGRYSLSLKG